MKKILINLSIIGGIWAIHFLYPPAFWWAIGLVAWYELAKYEEKIDQAMKQIDVLDAMMMNLHEVEHEHARDTCDWLRGDMQSDDFFKKYPGRKD